jgi:MFS family permease
MQAVGGILAMPFAGRLLHRVGGRTATRWLMGMWGAALALPAVAPDLLGLIAAFFCVGAVAGFTDVAIVSQAVAAEKRLGKPIMSGLHGLWSVGAGAASGVGALVASLGIGFQANLFAAAAIMAVLGPLAALALPPDPARPADSAAAKLPPRFSLPTGTVLLIGLVAFSAAFAEGSCTNWSAIYLNRVVHASQGLAAIGYTIFAWTMALTRLSGDRARQRFGPVRSVRVGGVIAIVGGAVIVLSRAAPLSIAGFVLLGAGVALVVPLSYAAAGHLGRYPAQDIAGVATVSYGSTLLGPGIVGGLADVTSLPVAFLLITAMTISIPVGARLMRSARVPTPEKPATAAACC